MKRIRKTMCLLLTVLMLAGIIPMGMTASAATYNWAGSWGSPAIESGVTLGEDEGIHLQDFIPAGSTLRTTVTPTIGGTQIRLKFSNLFGRKAITIDAASVAHTGETDDVVIASSITPVTFNGGYKSVTIAAGSEIYSDAIPFTTKALEKISISTYYKKTTTIYTEGLYGGTTYLAASLGDRTQQETMTSVATRLDFTSGTITYHTIPFLTRVDVYAENAYSVVLLGDSTVTNDMYLYLAQKLHGNGIHNVGVVMSGIIGNALLRKGTGLIGKVYGVSLLERAKRDAFDVAGVKYIIVKIGVNDVLHPMLDSNKGKLPMMTASEIIEGYKELSAQASAENVKMYLCTRTPFKGYERAFMGSKDLTWTQEGEDILQEINSWVKVTATRLNYYDGYINLDNLRDPKDNAKLRDHMTSDGAHLTPYGQIAAVDLIPEAAYGVYRELTDVATILKIDPYIPPAVPETTTKAPSGNANNGNNNNNNNNSNNNNNTNNNSNSNNNGNPIVITPAQPTTSSPTGNLIVKPQETPTINNANQIQVDNAVNNGNLQVGTVIDNTDASRQIAGFAILAAVSIAIIAVAAVMLIRMHAPSTSLTRGGSGRAKQKRRV